MNEKMVWSSLGACSLLFDKNSIQNQLENGLELTGNIFILCDKNLIENQDDLDKKLTIIPAEAIKSFVVHFEV